MEDVSHWRTKYAAELAKNMKLTARVKRLKAELKERDKGLIHPGKHAFDV